MSRRDVVEALDRAVKAEFGPDAYIGPINWSDGHRRMLLWNRRYDRAYARSRRNQPPREAHSG